jgi:hypothetical protein
MARKERTVVIETEGRDLGRTYLLREMPASQAEAWATRLLLALGKGGVEVPEGFLCDGHGRRSSHRHQGTGQPSRGR